MFVRRCSVLVLHQPPTPSRHSSCEYAGDHFNMDWDMCPLPNLGQTNSLKWCLALCLNSQKLKAMFARYQGHDDLIHCSHVLYLVEHNVIILTAPEL